MYALFLQVEPFNPAIQTTMISLCSPYASPNVIFLHGDCETSSLSFVHNMLYFCTENCFHSVSNFYLLEKGIFYIIGIKGPIFKTVVHCNIFYIRLYLLSCNNTIMMSFQELNFPHTCICCMLPFASRWWDTRYWHVFEAIMESIQYCV